MKALVTGGGGFLGTAIVRQLKARGDEVRTLSRNPHPQLDELGVEQHRGDVADPRIVDDAAAGCDVVFHTAAKAGIWGPFNDYFRSNVEGTRNVVDSCRKLGIDRLIFTSSPSVVFNGDDLAGADESIPYARKFEAAYPQTKAQAERIVLSANSGSLAAVSLRPHLIWGPGDTNLLPRIIARAQSGRLHRIGRTDPLIDPIYIDNAAEAHLLAADRLFPGSPIAGKIYFVTQGEPIPLWTMINSMLRAAQLPPVDRSIPAAIAMSLGLLMEWGYRIAGRTEDPPVTRFLVRELSTTHWFKIDAARRDLGYHPRVTFDEGFRRLEDWLRNGVCV